MNDDEKGYVIPTQIDTSGEVEKDDTLLGRERNNIINATNQVNSSIDTGLVNETNNKYKIKKTPLIVRFIAIVLSCLLIFFVAFFAVKYSKKFIEAGEETTTTTTSSLLDRSKEYWNKDIVKRYIDEDNKVYFFLPNAYNYSLITIEKSSNNIDVTVGKYDEKYISFEEDFDSNKAEYSISDKGLLYDNKELTISTGEYKYYTYQDDSMNAMLLINASDGLLQGIYITSDNATNSLNIITGKYMEYEDRIVLNGSEDIIFNKEENNVIYNNVKLTLHI